MKKTLLTIVLSLGIIGCGRSPDPANPFSYIGKELKLPECNGIVPDKGCLLKLVAYYDMRGCPSCAIKEMGFWKDILREIEEMENSEGFRMDVLFVVDSESRDVADDVRRALPSFGNYEVVDDSEYHFSEYNILPYDGLYHCFLLDRNNVILLIGNPLLNDSLWRKYKETMIQRIP